MVDKSQLAVGIKVKFDDKSVTGVREPNNNWVGTIKDTESHGNPNLLGVLTDDGTYCDLVAVGDILEIIG